MTLTATMRDNGGDMAMAMINLEKCDPRACESGICAARKACRTKAVYQEEPFEAPVTLAVRCNGCRKCLVACPQRAIYMA